jgi:hypothetical protein
MKKIICLFISIICCANAYSQTGKYQTKQAEEEVKWVATIPGRCNRKVLRTNGDQLEKDTVIISVTAAILSIFVGHSDKSCPYKIVLSDPREDELLTISEGIISETSPVDVTEVLLLKVDYTTNQLAGGQKLKFEQSPQTFMLRTKYEEPGDFGWVKVFFSEIDELLFYGDIVWHGCGDIIYPATWLNAEEFKYVLAEDYIIPAS